MNKIARDFNGFFDVFENSAGELERPQVRN
jgi:hypothetical protein